VCGADSAASGTKNACFMSYMDCVSACDIRKFDNEHWTLLYFSASFPSVMMPSLPLLFCELGEIAMTTDLWVKVIEYGQMTKQHCYISPGPRSIMSGSVQNEK